MVEVALNGIVLLPMKNNEKGSISYNQKHKSPRERWMTPVPKSGGNCAKEKTSKNIIDRNVHVRLDIREGNGV